MKVEHTCDTYLLTNESVDRISEQVEAFLHSIKAERANVLRVRLSLEEALLRWQDRFGKGVEVDLELGMHRSRPTITLRLAGAPFDPLEYGGAGADVWSDTLLSAIGLAPLYAYRQGVNVIQLKLPKPRANPATALLLSAAIGLLVGALGAAFLPESVRLVAVHTVLDPVRDAFFRMLNTAAAPIVFLSVLAVICGIGSVAAMNEGGWRMIVRFVSLSGAAALISGAAAFALFPAPFVPVAADSAQVNGVLDFLLQIVPADVVTPFVTFDSPQLILMAFVLGYAILVAGSQAEGLSRLVGEANAVALLVSDWLGRLSPLFMTLLLILGVWNGSGRVLLGLWKPLVLIVALTALMLLWKILHACAAAGVKAGKLLQKLREPFRVALRTASVDASYGANRACCEHSLGISPRTLDRIMPLGLVTYMPATTLTATVFVLYCAQAYGAQTSVVWFISAFFTTVLLQAATPPVPGMGLLAYAAIFSRLGIAREALTVALIADLLSRFLTVASDQTMLQLELLLVELRHGTVKESVLKK